MNQQFEDNEIDLFELFQTLWDSKALISLFVLITLMLGGAFIAIKEPRYESTINFAVNNTPPFLTTDEVINDFKSSFFSKEALEAWKKANPDSQVNYEELSNHSNELGFILAKDEDDLTVWFDHNKRSGHSLVIDSNELAYVNDMFEYLVYLSEKLKAKYTVIAKDELIAVEANLEKSQQSEQFSIKRSLDLKRYINYGRDDLIRIERPTEPKLKSPKPLLVLTLSVFLGGLMGVFFVLIRNAYRSHKKSLETV
jgi:capsular polysaccharide biosynthesis protein